MPALLGIVAFAADLGHVHSAKTQLDAGLAAAARYAAVGLADNTHAAKAIAAASQNKVDGAPLALSASDISVGRYNSTTRTFTVNGTPTNAARVTVGRTSGRVVPTTLARAIGVNSIAISGVAFAYDANLGALATPTGPIKGMVSLRTLNMNGPLTVSAWDSNTNTVLTSATTWAAPQVGGAAAVNAGVTIQGELQVNGGVSNNGSIITRGITAAPTNLSSTYPVATVPPGATNMGNYSGPSGPSQTFAAGTYYFTSFNVPAGKTVAFSGPSKVYVGGSCVIGGTLNTASNLPGNLKLYNTSGGGIDIYAGAAPVYAEIYAPDSPLNITSRSVYGSIVAGMINVSTASIYIDARTTIGGFSGAAYTTAKVVSVVPAIVN